MNLGHSDSNNMFPSRTHYAAYSQDTIDSQYKELRPTDRLLPIANISKIMKHPIPRSAKVAKDAKEVMQRAASEFIAIVTSMAKDICEGENRKTLTGDDLIRAMDSLGMGYYSKLCRIYLKKYREISKMGVKVGRMEECHNEFDEYER